MGQVRKSDRINSYRSPWIEQKTVLEAKTIQRLPLLSQGQSIKYLWVNESMSQRVTSQWVNESMSQWVNELVQVPYP